MTSLGQSPELTFLRQSPEMPFVGPRSYNTGEKLFGRKRETLELLDRLIAERIVLLYSPSGAGKTSLVQAGLVPALRDEDFTVPTVARVKFEVRKGLTEPVANHYVFALMLSLEEAIPREQQFSTTTLARMTLPEYLEQRWPTVGERGGWALIVDQFEEVLAIDPTDWPQKKEFFSQLGSALRSEERWALFSMREEYIAGLEPYRDLIPTQLHSDYRIDLLNYEQAQLAMRKTTELAGVVFEEDAARRLADDLRRVKVQRSETQFEEQLGPTVEPTVLQVVCWRLWSRLPSGKKKIEERDVLALGSVDSAIADYYAETMNGLGSRQRAVREWIGEELITQRGLRNQVLEEDAFQSGRLDAPALKLLEDSHLIRAERRRGVTWLELSHDRLVAPIQKSNTAWREEHLTTFQRQAALWENEDHPSHLELRGKTLADAERWAKEHKPELTEADKGLLRASRLARSQRITRVAIFLAPIALIVGIVAFEEYRAWFEAQPWGYVSNLFDQETHEASRANVDLVAIGRNVGERKDSDLTTWNTVPLASLVVSRKHLWISRAVRKDGTTYYRADDLRSLNGTTVNGRFLQYSHARELKNGDLISLAGVAVFRLLEAETSYVPLLKAGPRRDVPLPQGTWALLVDGASQKAVPLVSRHLFLSSTAGGGVSSSESQVEASVVELAPDADRGFAIINKSHSYSLFAMFKYEDRMYLSLQVPPGKAVRDKLDEMGRFLKVPGGAISGTEYFSKMSFCLGPPKNQKLAGFEGLAEIDSNDEPACSVGPFQIVIPVSEQSND
jgi:Novel STAND NTPase 1/FHA domain